MTMHGTIMVFFVLTTGAVRGFGTTPADSGTARRTCVPAAHQHESFWVTLVAFLVLFAAFFVGAAPRCRGWESPRGHRVLAPPLAQRGTARMPVPGQGVGQTLWRSLDHAVLRGAAARALKLITTTLDLRTTTSVTQKDVMLMRGNAMSSAPT